MKPNKTESETLSHIVTSADLSEMMSNAKEKVKNWKAVSVGNKGHTKGVAYNIFKTIEVPERGVLIGVRNAIVEFGEYLPDRILATIKRERKLHDYEPVHMEPDFGNYIVTRISPNICAYG